jgi:hypothetical protein
MSIVLCFTNIYVRSLSALSIDTQIKTAVGI